MDLLHVKTDCATCQYREYTFLQARREQGFQEAHRARLPLVQGAGISKPVDGSGHISLRVLLVQLPAVQRSQLVAALLYSDHWPCQRSGLSLCTVSAKKVSGPRYFVTSLRHGNRAMLWPESHEVGRSCRGKLLAKSAQTHQHSDMRRHFSKPSTASSRSLIEGTSQVSDERGRLRANLPACCSTL